MGENDKPNKFNLKKIGGVVLFFVALLALILSAITIYKEYRFSNHFELALQISISLAFAFCCVWALMLVLNVINNFKIGLNISLVINLLLGTLILLTFFFPTLFQSKELKELTDPSKTENSPANTDSLPPVYKPNTKKPEQNTGNEKKKILVYIHIGQFEKATSKWVETYISMDSLTKISDLRNSNDFETSQNTGCFVSLPKNLEDIVTVSNISYMIDKKVRINIKDVVLGYSQNGIDNYFAQIYIQP